MSELEAYGAPTPERRREKINEAWAAGLTVNFCGGGELQLDLDNVAARNTAVRQLQRFHRILGVVRVLETVSPGGNRHWYVALGTPLDARTRIVWQALLGSDPYHEALNLLFLDAGNEEPYFLVERKDAAYRQVPFLNDSEIREDE